MARNPVKLNLSKKQHSDLHDNIVRKFYAQQNLKKAKKIADAVNEQVNSLANDFMKQEDADEIHTTFFAAETDGQSKRVEEKTVRLTRVVRRKVLFDADALEEKLGKKFCKSFIHRQYEIIDWDGMVKLLKSYGVKPNEFLPFINLVKTVDEVALTQMESLGEISKSDIEGTFEVREISSYLQMTEVKDETKKK